jgi:hypothetical protein
MMGHGTRVKGECLSAGLLAALLQEYPDVRPRGWRRAAIDALLMGSRRQGCPRDFAEEILQLRFVPDAYAVSKADRWLHFFEIEVYNPMATEKLRAYGKWSSIGTATLTKSTSCLTTPTGSASGRPSENAPCWATSSPSWR